jgi:hypothetical protein
VGRSRLTDLVRKSSSRARVLLSVKQPFFDSALSESVLTENSSHPAGRVRINMLLAAELTAQNRVDNTLSRSVFGQLFNILREKPASVFRMRQGERPWEVKLLGFNATDAGGPFREVSLTHDSFALASFCHVQILFFFFFFLGILP